MILRIATLVDVGVLAAAAYQLGAALCSRRDAVVEARLEALRAAYEVDVAAWAAEREMYEVALSAPENPA